MNAVIIAVVVMLGLAVARVHVVLALLIGAIVGGLVGGLGIGGAFAAFQDGCLLYTSPSPRDRG